MVRLIIRRATNLNKQPYLWIFPECKQKEFTSDEEWKREHDEVSTTIRRQLFTIIMFSLFCILALGAPDIELVSKEADIAIPFSNTKVSYVGFLIFGPLILVAMLIYLHIFIGYLYELGVRDNITRLPYMFNLESQMPKVISDFLFYWLVPFVLAVFSWKALVRPQWQILISITAMVTFILLVVKIRRNIWRTGKRKVSNSNWLFLSALVVIFIIPVISFFNKDVIFTRSFNFYGSNHLMDKDLSGTVLNNAVMEKANLKNTNLVEASLRNANMKYAVLENTNLSHADLSGADFRNTNLATGKLYHATLKGVKINTDTQISDKWRNVINIINYAWDPEILRNLKKTSNGSLDLTQVNFSDADLSFLDLSGANLSYSDLKGAVLDGTNLSGTDLKYIKNYKQIASINRAVIKDLKNAPQGFTEWALSNGAISEPQGTTANGTDRQFKLSDGSLAPVMVYINPGRFMMGTYRAFDEIDRFGREEAVKEPFLIGKYEVTVGEFSKFVKATNYETDAEKDNTCKALNDFLWRDRNTGKSWRDPGFEQSDTSPVVCVSWNDVQAYITWLNEKTQKNYRLPSEKEWEYVAREGNYVSIYWDNANNVCDFANVYDATAKGKLNLRYKAFDCNDNYVYTAPVGSFKANKFNVHDMLGNVWEWVDDCSPELELTYILDQLSNQCSFRIFKGGAWHEGPNGPEYISAGLRWGIDVNKSGDLDGFRLAMSVADLSSNIER